MYIQFLGNDINAVYLCLVALVFLFSIYILRPTISKKKSRLYILGYHMIYSDARSGKKNSLDSKLLRSEKYDLTGKPDYIFKRNFGKALIPAELKSAEIKDADMPYLGDMLQLGAYFLIIEETFRIRPKTGRLIYRDYMFVIRNTSSIRKKVLSTVYDMRSMLETGNGVFCDSFIHCRHCMCRGTVCEMHDKLV